MVWRSRVIRTRSSRRSPGAAGARRRRLEPARGSCARRRRAPAPGLRPSAPSAAARTSSLVSRPSLPVPLIFDGIEMMLEHDPAHGGRQGQVRHRLGIARPRCSLRSAGFSPAPAGIDRASRLGDARPSGAAAAAPASRSGDHRADRDRVAVRDQLLAHRAGDRRRHLDRDLVGLEAGDRLVRLDRVAGLLQPLAERRLGDRFAQRRDFDFGRHVAFLQLAFAAAARRAAAMAERVGDQGRLLGGVALGKAGGGRGGGGAAGIDRPLRLQAGLAQARSIRGSTWAQ